MNEEQKAAFIFSQSICALAEIEGMRAENAQREHRGEAMAYVESDFVSIAEKYCIHHNAVCSFFS